MRDRPRVKWTPKSGQRERCVELDLDAVAGLPRLVDREFSRLSVEHLPWRAVFQSLVLPF